MTLQIKVEADFSHQKGESIESTCKNVRGSKGKSKIFLLSFVDSSLDCKLHEQKNNFLIFNAWCRIGTQKYLK